MVNSTNTQDDIKGLFKVENIASMVTVLSGIISLVMVFCNICLYRQMKKSINSFKSENSQQIKMLIQDVKNGYDIIDETDFSNQSTLNKRRALNNKQPTGHRQSKRIHRVSMNIARKGMSFSCKRKEAKSTGQRSTRRGTAQGHRTTSRKTPPSHKTTTRQTPSEDRKRTSHVPSNDRTRCGHTLTKNRFLKIVRFREDTESNNEDIRNIIEEDYLHPYCGLVKSNRNIQKYEDLSDSVV